MSRDISSPSLHDVGRRSRCQSSECSPRLTIIPEEDKGIAANSVLFATPEIKIIFTEDFRYIYEVERGITEVGFDDDFKSLKFWIPIYVEISGSEIPGSDCYPSKKSIIGYNTIQVGDFEEWRYMGGGFIEKVVAKVRRLWRQGWNGPDWYSLCTEEYNSCLRRDCLPVNN